MVEINQLIDQRARLVAEESKRQAELRQMMAVEQALLLAQAPVGIVRRSLPTLPDWHRVLQTDVAEFRAVLARWGMVGLTGAACYPGPVPPSGPGRKA